MERNRAGIEWGRKKEFKVSEKTEIETQTEQRDKEGERHRKRGRKETHTHRGMEKIH